MDDVVTTQTERPEYVPAGLQSHADEGHGTG